MTPTCTACGVPVPVIKRTGGLPRKCEDCKRSHASLKKREWRQSNCDAANATARAWHKKDPRRQIYYAAKRRALKAGLPFDLTLDDVVIPERCPALGIAITPSTGTRTDSSPSFDRVVPHKGYVRGNVAIISDLANRIKQTVGPKELRLVAAWLEAELVKEL